MTRRRHGPSPIRTAAAAIFAAVFVLAPATAEEVTLTSRSGALTLTGQFIGFDGEYLTVASPYGPLTVALTAVDCAGAACPDPATWVPELRLSGSPRMTEVLIPALVASFARMQGLDLAEATEGGVLVLSLAEDGAPVGRFRIARTSAAEGLADLVSHNADMALSVRAATADEIALAAEAGIGALDGPQQGRLVALDGLVPVVSPVRDGVRLDLGALADVLSGRITTWEALGGAAGPIALHLPEGGLAEHLEAVLLAPRGLRLRADAVRHPDTAALIAAVGSDTDALGFAGYDEVGLAQPIAPVDRCGVTLTPGLAALKTEDYPLTTPFYIYLPDRRLPQLARDFLGFLRTPAAHLTVRLAGFVDQGPVPIPLDAQGQRFVRAIALAGDEVALADLQRLVAVLAGHTRHSLSFRFEPGSTRLDAPSRSNLLALGQAVLDGRLNGRVLLFAGFSDGRGAAADNLELSRGRAAEVLEDFRAILAALAADDGRVTLAAEAFGEALPIGCDDTPWGRQMNRRVELWVSD